MNKFQLVLCFVFFQHSFSLAAHDLSSSAFPTLSAWNDAITKIPKRTGGDFRNVLTYQELQLVFDVHDLVMKEQLDDASKWVNVPIEAEGDFKPYVQKLVVPEGSEIIFWGDLHGNIRSLLLPLNRLKKSGFIADSFKITNPNCYMIFLGDFVDRGNFSIEVLYTLLRLKIANPSQVFLLRGNHEDRSLNCAYGFCSELEDKFGDIDQSPIFNFYEWLPLALFLGSGVGQDGKMNYVLCCHGGIEPGFDPHDLLMAQGPCLYAWLNCLNRSQWLARVPADLQHIIKQTIPEQEYSDFIPQSLCEPFSLGFAWFDFMVDDGESTLSYSSTRGWILGKTLTAYLLESFSGPTYVLRTVVRGHQHSGAMLKFLSDYQGLAQLWDGLVFTLLSTTIGGRRSEVQGFDSFVTIKTASRYQDWGMEHWVDSY